MDRTTTFLGWMVGGAGIVLIYSAYKNQSPVDVVRNTLSGEDGTPKIISGPISAADLASALSSPAGEPDAGRKPIKELAFKAGGTNDSSQWVSVASQPSIKLAAPAASSFASVVAAYGKPIPLSGGGRSYEAQVIGYAANPERFALPGNSLHEYGLAVDLNQTAGKSFMEDPKLIAAFTSNGWYRRGKRGKWYQGDSTVIPEPWHWSYGIAG